jgi:hypothetical protein
VGLSACGAGAPEDEVSPAEQEMAQAEPEPAEPGVVEVLVKDFSFTAPPTFPSGWIKLRFDNQGAETHFMVIWKLPEGKTFDDWTENVSKPFEEFYVEYRSGELEQAAFFEQLLAALPEWFFDAQRMGGPGFTAPGRVSETTIHLEPGDNYVLECYVRTKDQDDTFHLSHGMLRPLIVTEEASGMAEPAADVSIGLTNYAVAIEGDLTAGPHTARISVDATPEGIVLHNLQLVRLTGEQTAEEAAIWLDWVDHMVPPAPGEFLGGAGQTGEGRASYFSFDLEPGRYAWVSEAFGTRGMLHEFTVE